MNQEEKLGTLEGIAGVSVFGCLAGLVLATGGNLDENKDLLYIGISTGVMSYLVGATSTIYHHIIKDYGPSEDINE